MRTIHRIPSSIRVRRTDTEQSTNSFYSSADTYATRLGDADTQPHGISADSPYSQTPTQGGPSSNNDYFTLRGWRRGSTSANGGDTRTDRRDRATPSNEVHWQGSQNTHRQARGTQQDQDDDDETLRLEMQAARRAIHDQEHREQRERRGKNIRNPPGDYPPIRLSDESLHPPVPSRSTSRKPGAVEGLAMRHHRLHKEERRQKRKEQRNSVSTTSSQSSTSHPVGETASDDSTARSGSQGAPLHPPNNRNLSDVQEEGRASQVNTPRPVQADQANFSNSHTHSDDQRPPRPRRNTVAEDGLMATSRRLYDTLLRRRSDRDITTNDPEQQSALMRSSRGQGSDSDENLSSSGSSGMHEDEVVDYLDVVDPEVATVTALQNVGNSIFFPPIPYLYNRRPTISLPSAAARRAPSTPSSTPLHEARADDIEMGLRTGSRQGAEDQGTDGDSIRRTGFSSMRRVASLVPGRKKKQVPPTTEEERRKHIQEWAEMDEEERNELDEHVHLLLTKKAKFKRAARGFWRYVKTPHGFIITTYAFLITFWGTAICLFLLRWINVNNPARQRYWIEICDQILCALFAAVGLGFAPFRAVDTYRMVQIAHYHFLTYKRRRQMHLPELKDKNELPRAAPRLNVSQMTNTMMIKTGLRKSPDAATDGENDADAQGAVTSGDNYNTDTGHQGHAAATTAGSSNSSWEVLDAVQSRQSACEVEELKEKRKHKHSFFHRKKDSQDTTKAGSDKQAAESQHKSEEIPAHGSPPPPPSKTAHKTYPNKDGIIPLGQLKRNPSIASELPRDAEDVVVLSPKQQANLEYQQRKFHESHTFYRYRETVTHRPFELSLMMAIVILLDCHSCLQASLGGTTWGIYYKNRPTSVTATIITFSLSCNAVAGILIWLGGNRTKKKEEVERLLRIALEEEALRKMKKKQRRRLEAERAAKKDWEEQGERLHGGANGDVKGQDYHNSSASHESPPAETRGGDGANAVKQGSAPPSQTPALECIQEH
ncbi:uncharacterized protein UTRI_05801_B [Ustilago trichophora]|uniref:Integral membrane protein n=1 Tax=Ustilago trichophora TaxID=86804 RepID=A0A5C3EQA1_9BASI|nr:uncharacterized protein UTRI_05801_B [Ustilago trichophora]